MKAFIAEFIGVFALVFAGVGAIHVTEAGELTAVALAHGLAIALMILAVGHASGGHFNPAVTFGMLVTGNIKLGPAIGYWVSQLLGGLAAAALLAGLYGGEAVAKGTPAVGLGFSAPQGLVAEVILTFFLVLVIFATALHQKLPVAAFAIGLTITMGIMAGGVISGAAMNPARVLGPAIIGGSWADHWIYWVGPLVGAAIAAIFYTQIYMADEKEEAKLPIDLTSDRPSS